MWTDVLKATDHSQSRGPDDFTLIDLIITGEKPTCLFEQTQVLQLLLKKFPPTAGLNLCVCLVVIERSTHVFCKHHKRTELRRDVEGKSDVLPEVGDRCFVARVKEYWSFSLVPPFV